MLEPHIMALDVTGSLQLFGGPRALWRHILQACPPETRAGMAPSAWGAALLATRPPHRPRRTLIPASMQRLLDQLPCTVLNLTATAAAQLHDWGCDTLGRLRRFPRAGLAQRGLGALLSQLDRAYITHAPTAWLTPAPGFKASREPVFRGTSLAALETAVIPLLSDLCQYLQAHQSAIDRMEWVLHHDRAYAVTPETRLVLSLSRPQWEADACLRLYRLRFQSLRLPGPVHRVTLCCPHIQPRQPLPISLLPDTQVDQQRGARLLDVLQARLGAACLYYPRLRDWPLPEYAESWSTSPWQTPRPASAYRQSWRDGRPFWLLSTPTPLDTVRDRPALHKEPLLLLSGPERVEGGWWRLRNTSREYFTAIDTRSVRYWIYRDLKSSDWFLHGLFA